jgi:phenylpropionate dioxygenase-like ring-hydroxylating dioxygenase large terminal subunit
MSMAIDDRRSNRPFRDTRDQVPVLGYLNYWYPGLATKKLRKKDRPVHVKLLGEDLVFFRDSRDGKVYALNGWCPHRGAPLWLGKSHFPGTISCPYHGWTFDGSGKCIAALTDGPDSPVVKKVCVRSYPVEERCGMIWVWMGDIEPVPLEEDIPEELLDPDVLILEEEMVWNCNWRVTMDNAIDSAHAIYLHRTSPWMLFRKVPAWIKLKAIEKDPEKGAQRFSGLYPVLEGEIKKASGRSKWFGPAVEAVGFQADYPGLGRFPRSAWWRWREDRFDTMERLPGIFRSTFGSSLLYFRWPVAIDPRRTMNFYWVIKRGQTLKRFWFWLNYWLWWRWIFYYTFSNQDRWICELLNYSLPENLARTDVVVTAWRNLARGARAKEGSQEVGDATAR